MSRINFLNKQISYIYIYIYDVILTERERRNSEARKCSGRTVCGVHITETRRRARSFLLTSMARSEIQTPAALKADVWKYFGFNEVEGKRSWTTATVVVNFVE